MSDTGDLAVLVHELRAPVAALTALAAAAGASTPVVDPRMLALAIAAARDVERILGDPSLRVYVREDVALAELVAAVTLLDPARISADVPPALRVHGDPTRLRQALSNLVGNALRHGSSVTVTASRRVDDVVIDVGDDGPGVAPGVDPFLRGESGVGSTGFGLWIARTIAVAHGGTLELVPSAGGACFRLTLPSSSGGS